MMLGEPLRNLFIREPNEEWLQCLGVASHLNVPAVHGSFLFC